MDVCEDEYEKVLRAVEYYISKFINVKKYFINDFNIYDFVIHKIDNDTYSFSYDFSSIENLISETEFIFGSLSKEFVNITVKKCVSSHVKDKALSFTTIKIGKFEISDGVRYSDLYATIKRLESSDDEDEITESICHHQNYKFECGDDDLLNNFLNLRSIKWPILTYSKNLELVKNLWKLLTLKGKFNIINETCLKQRYFDGIMWLFPIGVILACC